MKSLALFDLERFAHDFAVKDISEKTGAGMLDIMYRHNGTMIVQNTSPPPENTSSSDSDSDITIELEQKRRQIEDEISEFRAQKEREFRDFEKDLRSNKRKMNGDSPTQRNGQQKSGIKNRPARTSSSSALDLLIGHGMTSKPQSNRVSPKKSGQRSNTKKDTLDLTLPSKPTLSLDPQNITGDIPHSNPHTPPTPTMLTRNVIQLSSTPPSSTSPPQEKKLASPGPTLLPTPTQERTNAFGGVFVPTYLPLLNARVEDQVTLTSALVTPPLEPANTIIIQQPIGSVQLPTGIVPVQSSSYPPSITVLSPTNPANKRSYTAPTVSATRIPSALRTASGGNLGRKRKRVTFRLADSAIVEPSSSYEEGPSPQMGESASTSTSSMGSSRNSINGGRGPRKSQLGHNKSSDQEDEEAGVKPGMNMGEVMQKLNEYNLASENDQSDLEYEDEDVGHFDVKYHEEEEDDEPMAMSFGAGGTEENSQTIDIQETSEDVDDDEEDGYFSPKAKHATSSLTEHISGLHAPIIEQQRHGSSPISPYRDENWDNLSSSDKDRLLFGGRPNDEEDSDGARRRLHTHGTTDQGQSSKQPNGSKSDNYTFTQAVDGGSGVGFFELDEELASPDAGVARPFDFPETGADLELVTSSTSDITANSDFDGEPSTIEIEDLSNPPSKSDLRGLGFSSGKTFGNLSSGGLKRTSSGKFLSAMDISNHRKISIGEEGSSTNQMPVGSIPINIIKPTPSVSSSWIGTFGH